MVRAWLILLRVRTCSSNTVCVYAKKYEYVWKGLQGESVKVAYRGRSRGRNAPERRNRATTLNNIVHSFIFYSSLPMFVIYVFFIYSPLLLLRMVHPGRGSLPLSIVVILQLLPMFVIYVFIVILHYYYVWFILGVDPSHCLPLSCGKLETPKQNVGQWGFAAGIIWPNLRGRNKQMV